MLLKIHPDNPESRKIDTVLKCLKNGGIIIYPTDSVYALGCDIQQFKAIEKICKIKGIKPEKSNFSLICNDFSQINEYTLPFEKDVFRLMKEHLPGPFTFILKANKQVSNLFKNNKKTIGIRIPKNNILQHIVNDLGRPLITTSIHDDDEIIDYTTDPEIIYKNYKNQVDIVIDGGYGDNQPTTVIDCCNEIPLIIRQGKGVIEEYV